MAPTAMGGDAVAESDLRWSEKGVVGTILRATTPLEVCRMAAGLHQYRQRVHTESGFSQTVEVIERAYREQAEIQGQPVTDLPGGLLGTTLLAHGKVADRVKVKGKTGAPPTVCAQRVYTEKK